LNIDVEGSSIEWTSQVRQMVESCARLARCMERENVPCKTQDRDPFTHALQKKKKHSTAQCQRPEPLVAAKEKRRE
jgi:hypothetical protein